MYTQVRVDCILGSVAYRSSVLHAGGTQCAHTAHLCCMQAGLNVRMLTASDIFLAYKCKIIYKNTLIKYSWKTWHFSSLMTSPFSLSMTLWRFHPVGGHRRRGHQDHPGKQTREGCRPSSSVRSGLRSLARRASSRTPTATQPKGGWTMRPSSARRRPLPSVCSQYSLSLGGWWSCPPAWWIGL